MYNNPTINKNHISLKFRLAIRNEKIREYPEKNFVYATLSGKKHTNTGIKIYSMHWDVNKNEVKKNCKDWWEYNNYLKKLKHYVDTYNYYIFKQNKTFNIDFISTVINNGINSEFYEYMIDLNDSQEKRVQDNYNRIIDDFCNFNDNIYFLSLDNCLLDNYDDYLIKKGYKHKTRQQYFNVLYTILDKMVLDNLLFPNHSNRYRALLIPNQ